MKKEKSIKKSDKNIENIQEKVLKANELSEENREKINLLIQKQTYYSGPLPHPEILAEYKKIYKDAPEIIFTTQLATFNSCWILKLKMKKFNFKIKPSNLTA